MNRTTETASQEANKQCARYEQVEPATEFWSSFPASNELSAVCKDKAHAALTAKNERRTGRPRHNQDRPDEKHCSQCKQWKPIAMFWKNRTRPDGYDSICTDCRRTAASDAGARDAEKRRAYHQAYRAAHRDELLARGRERRMNRTEERKRIDSQKQQTYREANRERMREWQRNYNAQHRQEIIDRVVEYRKQHPEVWLANAAIKQAVRVDRIMPPAKACVCADCGKQASHYHHESYEPEHWLDVVPLCASCHKIRHLTGEMGNSKAIPDRVEIQASKREVLQVAPLTEQEIEAMYPLPKSRTPLHLRPAVPAGFKFCGYCDQVRPVDAFPPKRSMRDGLDHACRECRNARARAYKARHRDELNRANRMYRAANPEKLATYAARYAATNSDRIRAIGAVRNAIQSRKLKPVMECQCVDCGGRARHYHHESYEPENRLDVVPLCVPCHKRRHRREEQAAVA